MRKSATVHEFWHATSPGACASHRRGSHRPPLVTPSVDWSQNPPRCPVFRVGPSDLSTAQAPGTHRRNAAYRLLVRGELLWPGRCNAVRSRPPQEEASCPARCDHKTSRPDPTTTRLALRLTILPPSLPPNGAGRPFMSEGKGAGQRGHSRDLPLNWNKATSVRQRHTGSDLGFCLRVELQTFSQDRKRSSDW
jgi:hypothetical protein